MKQKIQLYRGDTIITMNLEIEERVTDAASAYEAMTERQVAYVDKVFGVPTSKLKLMHAQQALDDAQGSVIYWLGKLDDLNRKIGSFTVSEDMMLTRRQEELLHQQAIAERTLKGRITTRDKAMAAVKAVEDEYTVQIDTFEMRTLD